MTDVEIEFAPTLVYKTRPTDTADRAAAAV
jgi:hypothetical protein